VTLTRAVQCDLTWTEDRAPVRTDPSAAPGAETEGRADVLKGTARPSLRDRHSCDKPLRPEAATAAAWSRTVFPYALPTRFQFRLNQDTCRVAMKNLKQKALECCSGIQLPAPPDVANSPAHRLDGLGVQCAPHIVLDLHHRLLDNAVHRRPLCANDAVSQHPSWPRGLLFSLASNAHASRQDASIVISRPAQGLRLTSCHSSPLRGGPVACRAPRRQQRSDHGLEEVLNLGRGSGRRDADQRRHQQRHEAVVNPLRHGPIPERRCQPGLSAERNTAVRAIPTRITPRGG